LDWEDGKMGRLGKHDLKQSQKKPVDIETEISLQESELRYRRLFESALDGILILNAETGRITDVNPYLVELLGYSKNEILGKELWEIGSLRNVSASKDAFLELQNKLSVKYDDLPLETRDGRHINVEFVSNVYDEGDKKVIQCNIRNITTRKTAENKFHYFSTHDSLTKLYNRSFFMEELARLEHSRQFPISIIMLDIDGLKKINDILGHAAGDEVLYRTAQVLTKSFRSEDILARIGGDEFAVLLPDSDENAVRKALARIEHFTDLNNKENPKTLLQISIGTSTCKTPCSLSKALKVADNCMYKQKRSKTKNL
jgi:diguanylate cyclase (GGDEF)-like protein/PAS domain S-box-containing protein